MTLHEFFADTSGWDLFVMFLGTMCACFIIGCIRG